MTDKAVTQADDGTWTFTCPYPPEHCCIEKSFTSTDWADKAHAVERGAQHIQEHGGGGPMEDLNTFRERRGIIPAQPMSAPDALKALEK